MNKENHTHQQYISNPIEVLNKSAKQLFDNFGIVAAHFGISLAAFMPFGLAIGLAFLPAIIAEDAAALTIIPIILAAVLALPFMYVISWVGLAQKRINLAILDGRKPTFKEVFKHDTKKIFGLIGLAFLVGLAVIGGYLLLIIPGIILTIMFSYAPFIYVRKDIGVVDAMGESFSLVKSSWQELLGVGSVFFIYRIISQGLSNIPLLGVLLSFVLMPIDIFVAYWQDLVIGYRYTSIDSGVTRPKVDSLNWVFIGLAIGIVALAILVLVFVIIYVIASGESFSNLMHNYTVIFG